MKRTCAIALMAATGMLICLTGCKTTAPTAAATPKNDVKFAEKIEATATADQKLIMDGKKYEVAEVPAQLAKMNCDKYITIIVLPESKLKRETLVQLVDVLVKSKYYVLIDPKSKYADVPIPPRPQ